jgi:plasmid maintenance system killer protein
MYNDSNDCLLWRDKTTEDIFHGYDTKAARKIARVLWARVQVKLDLLNASTTLEDLRVPHQTG